ncbi:MAG: putative metalloprotease CJM1_0395 family protein [Pseudomonadota bacterium]
MASDASPSLSAALASLNPMGRPGMGGARIPESVEQAGERATSSAAAQGQAAGESARNRAEIRDQAIENRRRVEEQQQAEARTARLDEHGQRVRDQVDQQRRERALQELSNRDREVRSHEQAHLAAGGSLTSSVSYSFIVGPDGKRYAIGGNVDVDTSPVSDDPEATLEKARKVRAAALAPANPSPQDRQIAAEAAQMAQEARMELRLERQEEGQEAAGARETDEDPLGLEDPLEVDPPDRQRGEADPNGAGSSAGGGRTESGDPRDGAAAVAGGASRQDPAAAAGPDASGAAPAGVNLYV